MCQHPVDMRKGINGLYKLVRSEMKMSPLTGSVFIFYGKNHQSVKLLRWDTDGFVLYQKRLEKGTFEIPKFDEASGGLQDALEDVFSDHAGCFAPVCEIPQEI